MKSVLGALLVIVVVLLAAGGFAAVLDHQPRTQHAGGAELD